MAKTIFNTDEQNIVRNAICQQLYIANEGLKLAIESNDLNEIADHSAAARDYTKLAHDIPNFTCKWTISDYETMVKPLEQYIEMGTDGFDDDDIELPMLYTAVAALAKIKLHFTLYK